MNYWNKTRPDMKMASDLKLMHRSKTIDAVVPVFSKATFDEDGRRIPPQFIENKVIKIGCHIAAADRHRMLMGRRG